MAAKKPMPKGKGNPFMDKMAAKKGGKPAPKAMTKKAMPKKGARGK